ncbi:MAG TPA: hypothetical protein VIR33_03855 [Thermopolyspora sp.]|jgi:hypothetical protein
MSEPQIDPAGNTQQFKAFAQRREPEEVVPARPSYLIPSIIGAAVIIIAAVVVFLIVS